MDECKINLFQSDIMDQIKRNICKSALLNSLPFPLQTQPAYPNLFPITKLNYTKFPYNNKTHKLKTPMNAQMQLQRLQNQIQQQVKKYNGLQKKAQGFVQARNSLYQQESQNSLVLKQIELLLEDAKIYKQVGSVLIDQNRKQVKTTLNHRIGHINTQIDNTSELIKKNDAQQKALAEKIQKAKDAYYKMVSMIQQQSA